jgi:hypothetical protein
MIGSDRAETAPIPRVDFVLGTCATPAPSPRGLGSFAPKSARYFGSTAFDRRLRRPSSRLPNWVRSRAFSPSRPTTRHAPGRRKPHGRRIPWNVANHQYAFRRVVKGPPYTILHLKYGSRRLNSEDDSAGRTLDSGGSPPSQSRGDERTARARRRVRLDFPCVIRGAPFACSFFRGLGVAARLQPPSRLRGAGISKSRRGRQSRGREDFRGFVSGQRPAEPDQAVCGVRDRVRAEPRMPANKQNQTKTSRLGGNGEMRR